MEYHRQRGESGSGDLVGQVVNPVTLGAKFVDQQNSGAGLGNVGGVIELTRLPRGRVALIIEPFVQQVFDGGKTAYVIHQFLYAVTGFGEYLFGGAGNAGRDGWFRLINSGGLPRHRQFRLGGVGQGVGVTCGNRLHHGGQDCRFRRAHWLPAAPVGR